MTKFKPLRDQIIDYCRTHAWFHDTTTLITVARNDGRTLWIMCAAAAPTPYQQGVIHWLGRNKQIVAVVYSIEDFIAVSKMP